MGRVENSTVNGTTAFATYDQRGSNYSDYTGSIVEVYVNNYASYLDGLGANIKDARLITKDELEKLGCNGNSCSGAPEFVYQTSYWTSEIYDSTVVWYVDTGKVLGYDMADYNGAYGVRPVIEISLSEF